jgi:Fe-S cluster assembly protein SufD
MEHAKPHCVSNELFKGVLDGKGESIFNGHILVAQDAQKTNAYQTNRNVILSDDADAFAKPFLEIYADDVRCSHGATIGQLDENALFYLRSRGLTLEKARSFLIHAFVGEVIEECDHDAFRSRMEAKVNDKLEGKK